MSKTAKFKVTNCDLKHIEQLKEQIFIARRQRVMLDQNLAKLYGVTTKQLNQQLKRNLQRFPKDFAFQLTLAEAKNIAALRSQNVTLKRGHHIKHPPHVFTEHGAIMLASVLSSRVAVQASIYVVRAFVQMRAALLEYADLSRRVDELAATYDHRFQQVFAAIRDLMAVPENSRRASRVRRRQQETEEGETVNISRRVFFSLMLVRPRQSVSLRVAVLETFAMNDKASAILVNHAEPAERDHFARWLQANPRSVVRIRNKAGQETGASIFRVRMCFGRGLILPNPMITIREGEVLTLIR